MSSELEAFRERYKVAAVGAAVVRRDGPAAVEVAGRVSHMSDEAVETDDLWHIGSCCKAITAALYGRLVEAGAASFDSPIGSFFPDLEAHPGWMDRSVAEALTCQAGIRPNPTLRELRAARVDTRPIETQRLEATRIALSVPPHNPGRFRYSNLGYVVVGSVIERVTQTSFERALLSLLLDPLGMTSAGFGPPPRIWGHGGQLQLGALATGRGSPAPPGEVRSDNPELLTPAGRLHLSLGDWGKFNRMILSDGGSILNPKTVGMMLTTPTGGRMAMGWASAVRLDKVLVGMQGSNTKWSASALISDDRTTSAMVVANDGRTRVLGKTTQLAHRLLLRGL